MHPVSSRLRRCAATVTALCAILAGCNATPEVEVRLRVDDLDRGTQHGATVSWDETMERATTILRTEETTSPTKADTAVRMVTAPPASSAALRRALSAVARAPQEAARRVTLAQTA
ncbi:MAG: hypothetical protein ACPHRO_15845, partial [Nannocystaceae bacterium]